MINYTTPTITLVVEGADLTGQEVYVTLEQSGVELTKNGEALTLSTEGEDTIIVFTLTQVESAYFDYERKAQVQVNFINAAGVRDATNIAQISVFKNLLDKVVNYGD